MVSIASASINSGLRTDGPNSVRPKSADKAESGPGSLSEADQRKLEELKKRDREVRAHESAHLAAAGGYATGGANFQLTRGPDGGMYATGGEVGIDVSPVSGDPAATIRKAETIRRAALAPAEPSPQDRRVSQLAAKMAIDAQAELAQHSQSGSQPQKAAGTYAAVAEAINPKSKGFSQIA